MNFKKSKLSMRLFLLSVAIVMSLPQFATAQSIVIEDRTIIVTGTQQADSVSIWDSPNLIVAQLFDSNQRMISQRGEIKTEIDAIKVVLMEGNDYVEVDALDFDGDLKIETGSGDDLVEMANLNVNYLKVTEGSTSNNPPAYANAKITLVDSRAESVVLQSLEATVKDSTAGLLFYVAANTQILQNINCWYLLSNSDNNGQSTNHEINQIRCNQLYVYCSNNRSNFNDTVNMSGIASWFLDVRLDNGFDNVVLAGSQIMGSTNVTMGDEADRDYVYMNNLRTQGNVTVQTGNAADSVVAIQCEIEGTLTLKTLDGNDYSLLYNSDFNSLSADLGRHNDRIRISSSDVSQAQMNGGSGLDTLDIRNRATINQLAQQGFETILD